MKRKLTEHIVSMVLVTAAFATIIYSIHSHRSQALPPVTGQVQQFTQLKFVDFGDPLDRALFHETLNVFYPDSLARNDSLMQAINAFRMEQFTNALYKTGSDLRGLTREKLKALSWMYLQFIMIYVVVLLLSYYGAQTLGVIRFVQMKQQRFSSIAEMVRYVQGLRHGRSSDAFYVVCLRLVLLFLKACGKGVFYLVLFAPAYVIAYSFKTKLDTNSNAFMILLGVISNGLLINYGNRFYTFLIAESRKGYVETAVVKNLNRSYAWSRHGGISWKSALSPTKSFPSHVFQHIYVNADSQFLATLKEYASFLITGLVIIEMALNIQGHLSYEMLKNILSKQYDVVLCIVLMIFLLVKATEIVVDVLCDRDVAKYGNRTE